VRYTTRRRWICQAQAPFQPSRLLLLPPNCCPSSICRHHCQVGTVERTLIREHLVCFECLKNVSKVDVLLSTSNAKYPKIALSLAIPHPRNLCPPDLVLQLENAIKQRLSRRRASRDIDIHGDDTIDSPQDTIAVVIVASAIGTAAHTDDPLGVWHLIVE
jgi:hypothetical protein